MLNFNFSTSEEICRELSRRLRAQRLVQSLSQAELANLAFIESANKCGVPFALNLSNGYVVRQAHHERISIFINGQEPVDFYSIATRIFTSIKWNIRRVV